MFLITVLYRSIKDYKGLRGTTGDAGLYRFIQVNIVLSGNIEDYIGLYGSI